MRLTTRGLPGDVDLTNLSGFPTCDATVLEFDFVPNKNRVFLQYVFASEEYNEFVNAGFADVFALTQPYAEALVKWMKAHDFEVSFRENLRRVYSYRKQVLAIFDGLVLNEQNSPRLQ